MYVQSLKEDNTMLKFECLTKSAVTMSGPCDPDYEVCGPDSTMFPDACSPELSPCGPDYGTDCMPDCDPSDNW